MSVDGRSADVAGLTAMFGAAAAECDSDSIMGANFEAKAWTWPGVFDFANLDAVLGNFLECAQAAAIMVNFIQTFSFQFCLSSLLYNFVLLLQTCEDDLRASLAACAA